MITSDKDAILAAIAASEARTREHVDSVSKSLHQAIQIERESNIKQDVELKHLVSGGKSMAAHTAHTGAISAIVVALAETVRHLLGK